jgi:hypothetical protein
MRSGLFQPSLLALCTVVTFVTGVSVAQEVPLKLGDGFSEEQLRKLGGADSDGLQFTNTVQYGGNFTVVGPFTLDNAASEKIYKVPADKFGTFTLMQSMNPPVPYKMSGTENILRLREGHYNLHMPNPSRVTERRNNSSDPDWLGVGVRILPVANGQYKDVADAKLHRVAVWTKPNSQGLRTRIYGSQYVDSVWKKMVYGDDKDPGVIFAPIVYSNPEHSAGALGDLSQMLKTEQGMTHMGLYTGNGFTINSPTSYHENTWWGGIDCGPLSNDDSSCGYPALIYSVHYKYLSTQFNATKSAEVAVMQPRKKAAILEERRVFNQNAKTVLEIINQLNGGPEFPPDYKHDWYETLTLKNHLEFFADWIEGGDKAKRYQDNPALNHYCAEHITIGLNIALNVPQNLKGYQEVYGVERGSKLWTIVQRRWLKERHIVSGRLWGPVAATQFPETPASFKPLWKAIVEKAEARAKKVTNSSDQVRFVQLAGNPRERIPNRPPVEWDLVGMGVAWPFETTSDLMADFITQYARFTQVGPVVSALALIGFQDEAVKRLRMDPGAFFMQTTPFIRAMFAYDLAVFFSRQPAAARNAQVGLQYLQAQRKGLRDFLVGKALAGAGENPAPEVVAAASARIDGMMAVIFADGVAGEELMSAGGIAKAVQVATMLDGRINRAKKLPGINAVKIEQVRSEAAFQDFRRFVSAHTARVREIQPACDARNPDEACVKYYSPPAVLPRVIAGIRVHEPLLGFSAIGTVVDGRDTRLQENCLVKSGNTCKVLGQVYDISK